MSVQILIGDARERLKELPDASVHCCVTSPPYFGLRDYGCEGQMGLEATPAEFVAGMVDLFREVRRVLRDDGTLWLNLGDSYAASGTTQWPNTNDGFGNGYGKEGAWHGGEKIRPSTPDLAPKQLIGIPWRVAFALQADGWWLRQDIIWSKPNPMPESVRDRCTKAHEYLFLLSKGPRYFYDADAVAEGRAQDEDSSTFRGGCYIQGSTDNSTMGKRKVPGNKRHKGTTAYENGDERHRTKAGLVAYAERERAQSRGVPPRHAQYPESSDQSGLDEVGRGGTRNKRSVWTVATQPFSEAHFATYPPALIEPCILAGSSARGNCVECGEPWARCRGGFQPACGCYDMLYRNFPSPRRARKRAQREAWTGRWKRLRRLPGRDDWKTDRPVILDPFGGAGTTGMVADRLGRNAILIELNPEYAALAERRIQGDGGMFAQVNAA